MCSSRTVNTVSDKSLMCVSHNTVSVWSVWVSADVANLLLTPKN